MTFMNHRSPDPVISLKEAASRMGVKIHRARNILRVNGIHPVVTSDGVGYRLDDILDVRKFRR